MHPVWTSSVVIISTAQGELVMVKPEGLLKWAAFRGGVVGSFRWATAFRSLGQDGTICDL